MTTDNHIIALIDAYLAGGLDDAERRAFDAHVASCGDCATAVDAARAADSRLADALADALPGPGFEDRLIGALRPAFNKPSLRHRLSRPIRHPLVRRIATGVAAAIVVGSIGYGMSVAVERQAKAQVSEDKPLQLKPGIDILSGTSLRREISVEGAGVSPEDDLRRTAQLEEITRQRAAYDARVLVTQASKARAEGKMQEAYNLYSQAAAKDPQNQAALESRNELASELGLEVSGRDALTAVTSVLQQRKEETSFNFRSAKQEFESAIALEQFETAQHALNEARAAVTASPGVLTTPEARDYNEQLTQLELSLSQRRDNAVRAAEQSQKLSEVERLTAEKSRAGTDHDQSGPQAAANFYDDTLRYPHDWPDQDGRSLDLANGTARGGSSALPAITAEGTQPDTPATSGPVALQFHSNNANFADAPDFNLESGAGGGGGGGGGVDGSKPQVQIEKEISDRQLPDLVKQRKGENAHGSELDTLAFKPQAATFDGRWFKPPSPAGWAGESEKLLEQLSDLKPDEKQEVQVQLKAPDGGTLLLGGQTLNESTELDADRTAPIKPAAGLTLDNSKREAGEKDSQSGGITAARIPGEATPDNKAVDNKAVDNKAADNKMPGKTPADSTPAASTPAAEPPATRTPVEAHPEAAQQNRKIIRNGNVAFEVDSFDSALVQVTKIAQEEGGFIATTSSAKLPNGKVSGAVTVRVPPERLDTVVLKLRGIGDLKTQRISAEDVTKRYTDIESQLRAATAMEERLLAIIKTGGDVADLLEAEKQLGVWREKLELLKGEIKYFDNLVSLSTLVVELMERDVRTPTAAFEVETVNTAVETEEVENVRAEVLKAIEQAKGRVIDSDLKKLEAGQLSSTIVATVAPDGAGPVIDRLKQLGKLARLDISRKTMTEGGTGPIVPGLRVEKKETRFEIHIYNLANIEPRQTTSLSLAAEDVEAAFRQIIDHVNSAGGQIKTSQLSRPRPDQSSGTIVFQVTAEKADVVLGAIRGGVDVMRMDVQINPDTQNTTEAKCGFAVQIASLAQIPARETTTLQVAAADVPAAFRELLAAANAGDGRVLTSQLNEQDANNITGQLEFEVSRQKWPGIDSALAEAGMVVSRNVVRSADTDNTVDSKVRLSISLMDEVRLSPRETINATVATRAVPDTFTALLQSAKDAGARVVGSNLNLADRSNPSGTLRFATPRENAARFEQAMKEAGLVTSRAVARLPDGPMTVENKVGYIVTVIDERTLKPRESHQMVVVAPLARERYRALLEALRPTAMVLNSQLSVQNQKDITGTLEFIVDRDNADEIERVLAGNADVFNRTIDRSQDTQGTVDTKVRYGVTIKDADQQPPRQTYTLGIETRNIDKAVGDLETSASAVGGRKLEAERARGDRRDVARVVVDVPIARVAEVIASVRGQGEVTVNQSQQNESVPEGSLSRARVGVTFTTPATVATEKTFGESLREGMSGALTGLFKVVQWVIFGLVVIVPCLILIWLAYLVLRMTRSKKKPDAIPPVDSYGPTPNPT